MQLHLPLLLRKSVLICIALATVCTLSSGTLAYADNLVLGAGDKLSVDYAAEKSIPDLDNGTLQLEGDTLLQLLNCGSGDGKTYTLATGVSGLLDAQKNVIELNATNNTISNYFDASQPGAGFWAGGTLQLNNGALQMVLHNETVKDALEITTRQEGDAYYRYYEGVSFERLSANGDDGGAIDGYGGTIILSNNGSVDFHGNNVENDDSFALGGAIYGSGTLSLTCNGKVEFCDNSVYTSTHSSYGGAIYWSSSSTLTMSNNNSIIFRGNKAISNSWDAGGGAMTSYGKTRLCNNGKVLFSENSVSSATGYAGGGALSGWDIALSYNDSVTFNKNSAVTYAQGYKFADGGAIRLGTRTPYLLVSYNGQVTFSENSVFAPNLPVHGGAISGAGEDSINFNHNGCVLFDANTATSHSIVRDSNAFTDYASFGGAVFGSCITMNCNDVVIFQGNKTTSYAVGSAGGAVYGHYGNAFTMCENGSIAFVGNEASSCEGVAGGAIFWDVIRFVNNGSVEFVDNIASTSGSFSARGGAIYGDYYSGTPKEYNGVLFFSNNRSVRFSGNVVSSCGSAAAYGGAYYGAQNSDLFIQNNGSVLFEKNVEVNNGLYRLRGIYVEGGSVTISAAEDMSVEIRESIYVGSGSTFNLNADYTYQDEDGKSVTIKQQGDIIFTGATTVDDLYAVKGDVAGSEEEIRLSRTSEVNALTNLYGGRLRVEDGAIYQGQGITVHEGAEATVRVKDAELSHVGYDLTFNSGTTLEVEGNCTITGNVKLQNGSNLVLSGSGAEIVGNASSSFLYAAGAAVSSSLSLQDYGSVTFTGNLENSESSRVDGGAVDGRSISLKNNGNVLFSGNVLNTDSSAFAEGAFGGAIKGGEILLAENESVIFIGNQANSAGYSSGGALDTDTGIQISNNGDVQFVENASFGVHNVFGGAIYVFSGTTLLSGNASVCFRGNSSTSSSYAYGGAIGFEGNSLDFRDNGTLQFFENKVVSTGGSARGGAIYSEYNLNIQNNDLVEFYQNAEVNNGIYRLRSIYSSWGNVNLSSAEGKYILFRDSVYIGSSSTLNLNADYGTIKQQGDIIFTGATTVNDLYAVKGDVAGTEEEIRLSRTTEVKAMTNLYGGRLRVEDGAIYQGQGITVHEDSEATVRVKDAELSHVGYELTFNSGTSLEVAGESTIRGLVNLQEGSVFKLELGAVLCLHETAGDDAATLSVSGTAFLSGDSTLNAGLTLADGATLDMDNLAAGAVTLNGALTFSGQVSIGDNLLALLEDIKAQTEGMVLFTGIDSLTLPDVATTTASARMWAGSVFSNLTGQNYYLDYKAETGTLSIVSIPEPATATLSLLALAALAARRRRKS